MVSQNLDEQARALLASGQPPDLIIHPEPRLLAELIGAGFARGQSGIVDVEQLRRDQVEGLVALGEVDGELYAVVLGVDLKSLVWYVPSAFEAAGYGIPATWEELMASSQQMIADGRTPWCLGSESGPATGWVLTDWLEDVMLRLHGGEVYNAWVRGELPFDSPQLRQAIGGYLDPIWFGQGMVDGGPASMLETSFFQSPQDLLEGRCMMHRQASFISSLLPPPSFRPSGSVTRGQMASFLARALDLPADPGISFQDVPFGATHAQAISAIAAAGITLGFPIDVGVFALPRIAASGQGDPVLITATMVAAYTDTAEVDAFLAHVATPASSRPWAATGAWLSPFSGFDPSAYPTALLAAQGRIVAEADFARFDGSDLMPHEVGGEALFTELAAYVGCGGADLDLLLANLDAAWPD